MTRSRHKPLSFAALALALLIAQVGALAHGYTHVSSTQKPVGIAATAGQICAECLSFTPLLSAVDAPAPVAVFHPYCATEAPRIAIVSPFASSPRCAFRARAPPHLV